MKIPVSILAVVCLMTLVMTVPAVGQAKFSQADFATRLSEALVASERFARRISMVEETRIGSRLIGSTQTIEDFLPPDSHRYVDTISSGGKSNRRGGHRNRFCRVLEGR